MRCWLLAWLLACPLLSSAEPLKVATMPWAPFRMDSPSGQLIGLDIDLLNELGRRTGLTFDIRVMPWARALDSIRQGQVDLMTGLAYTAEREVYVDYLLPAYHVCAPRFYGAPQLAERVREYADLKGLRIGYVLQSAYFQPFDDDSGLDKIGVNGESQLLQMLQLGRIDLLVGTDCQVDYERRVPQLAQRLVKMAYQPPSNTPLFVGYARRSPRQAERTQLALALQQVLKEGWLQRRARHYWGQR